jgi:hypothetical protein
MRIAFASAAMVVVWATFGVACGERDTAETAGEAAEESAGDLRQMAEALAGAADEGAVARGVRAAGGVSREAAHEVEDHGVVGAVEEGADVLRGNVEHSTQVAGQTYRDEREQGVGRIEAAGVAYEAVLEIPKTKAAAEEEKDPSDEEDSG